MKNQALFSSKDKSKKLKCRLLQFLFGALMDKLNHTCLTIYCFDKNNAHINDQKGRTKDLHDYHFCIVFNGRNFWLLIPSAHITLPEYRLKMTHVFPWYLKPQIRILSLQLKIC